MSKELRIGVIGPGGRGRIAKQAHLPEKGSRVVACCDINPKVIDRCKEDYGNDVFFCTDYRDLLKQGLDGVIIGSPDWVHEEQGLACIEAGIPIYLEKPFAITIDGCDRMLKRAKEKNVRLFVGHNMRYMTIIRKMKQLVDDGRIGEVKSAWCRHFINYGGDAYFRDWHAEQRYATGLLLQKGAHDIDVIHWICNARSTKVSAFGNLAVYGDLPRKPERPDGSPYTLDRVNEWTNSHWPPKKCTGMNPRIDVEDQTTMIMEMENGILGAYLQCHFTPDSTRNYTFIGTEGRIENYGDSPESPIMLWNKRHGYQLIGDEVYRGDPLSPEAEKAGHGGSDYLIVQEFVEHIRSGCKTTATPQAARYSVAAGYLATMSLREGGVPKVVPALPADIEKHQY